MKMKIQSRVTIEDGNESLEVDMTEKGITIGTETPWNSEHARPEETTVVAFELTDEQVVAIHALFSAYLDMKDD